MKILNNNMETPQDAANYKNFDSQIKNISLFETIGTTQIRIIGYEKCNAELIRTKNQFILKVSGVYDIRKTSTEVPVIIDKKKYVVKVSDVVSNSFHADILSGVSRTQTFDVQNIQSLNFEKDSNSKFRCFFPTDANDIKSFCYLFETVIYQNDTTRYAFDCIRINAGQKEYDITQIANDDYGFYIIESLEDESYDAFMDNCFAIQQSLGFLLGYMPGGEQYVFANDAFQFSRFVRPALKSFYNPVTSNPHSRLSDHEVAKVFEAKLAKIPATVFSNFVNLMREKDELSMAVILLMEATSVKSLLLIPSVFAVIIEALAKSISVAEEGKILPIDDFNLSDKIIKELIAVIDSNCDLKEDGALKLKNRILNINKPVVKQRLTNNEKLTFPFHQLGIKLTLQDIMAIEHRNDLLHGNISLKSDGRSSSMVNGYMMHIMDRLYTLIAKLLLKSVGFNGFIINYPKFSENAAGVVTDEGHFVEI